MLTTDLFGVCWDTSKVDGGFCWSCSQPLAGSTVVSSQDICNHDPIPWQEVVSLRGGVPFGSGEKVRPLTDWELKLFSHEPVEHPDGGYVQIPEGHVRRRKRRTIT